MFVSLVLEVLEQFDCEIQKDWKTWHHGLLPISSNPDLDQKMSELNKLAPRAVCKLVYEEGERKQALFLKEALSLQQKTATESL